MKWRPWLEGAGLALLYLLPLVALMLSPTRRSTYHQLLPPTTLMRGMLLDLIVLSLASGVCFLLLKRSSGRRRELLGLPLFLILGWLIGRDVDFSFREPGFRETLGFLLPYLHYFPFVFLAVAVIMLVFARRAYQRLTAATAVLLAAGGIASLLVVFPRIAYGSFNQGTREEASFHHEASSIDAVSSADPRIVWVLFDELSYDQLFPHRAAGLQLPTFDQLAKNSLYFSHLQPVGLWTERVIPSLLLGQQIDDIRVNQHGYLSWKGPRHRAWQRYDPQQTVFGQAQRLGWTTGVAGWFNPYCRLLQPVLNDCFWVNSSGLADGLFDHQLSRQTTLENALYALPFANDLMDRFGAQKMRREDLDTLLNAGGSLIRNPSLRFIFIHLPIPHPPGVYQRPGVSQPHASSYLDNLVLTDHCLADLQAAIASTPAADRTTLIVSSDHSWRVQMWRFEADWTKEDEQASHGVFEDRPVLMVHYPGETTSDRVDTPTSAMEVHSIVLDLLSGKIHSTAELDSEVAAGNAAKN